MQAVHHVTLYKEMAMQSVSQGTAYARASIFGTFKIRGSSVAPADNTEEGTALDDGEALARFVCAGLGLGHHVICKTSQWHSGLDIAFTSSMHLGALQHQEYP